MRIMFVAGGTGGHINPAVAVANEIRRLDPTSEILFVGTEGRMETQIVPKAGFSIKTVKMNGLSRSLSISGIIENVKTVILTLKASGTSKKIIKEFKPDVVVGTGGYVSGPVLREAAKLGIKTAIHEQNAFPGVTTKMLANSVDKVMLAMPAAINHMKLKKQPEITGNPVRSNLISADKLDAKKQLKMDDRPVLLSFGGSLGAKYINKAVCDLIKWHNGSKKFYHIHATGKVGNGEMLENLKAITLSDEVDVREYIDDMQLCMAAADLVICRAGAITLSELQICGKPAILIPSPYVAENHQFHNAMVLKNAGAAEIIEEKDLSGEKLIEVVSRLIENKPKLAEMAQKAKKTAIDDANTRIYKIIMDLYTAQ